MRKTLLLVVASAFTVMLTLGKLAHAQSAPDVPAANGGSAAAALGACNPPPPPDAPTNILHLRLQPDSRKIARYYPERAQRLRISGQTSLRCLVTSQGELVTCTVLAEIPPGWGFGAASQLTAKTFSFAPVVRDGAPLQCGVYQFNMNWVPH